MPGKVRRSKLRAEGGLTEAQWAFLNDALTEDIGTKWERYELEHDSALGSRSSFRGNRDLWTAHGREVMQRWVRERPGTRPALWWRFDAPRQAERPLGCFAGEDLPPVLRLRLGGTGTPLHECSNTVLAHRYGVPRDWAFDLVEIPAGPRGPACTFPAAAADLVDPEDPPLFEAQAAYLERHGLLLPSERRRLAAEDFEPEALACG